VKNKIRQNEGKLKEARTGVKDLKINKKEKTGIAPENFIDSSQNIKFNYILRQKKEQRKFLNTKDKTQKQRVNTSLRALKGKEAKP